MRKAQERLSGLDDGDRQMVALLPAARDHGVETVEQACAEAMNTGLRSADAILNILSRQTRQAAPREPVVLPAHLRLRHEPLADCARYDRLAGEAVRGAA